MLVLIVSIIFLCSFVGIVIIFWKKIPILLQMPEISEGVQKEKISDALKKKIANISFDKLIFLKTLSKTRILILKLEKFIDSYLQKMRKKIIRKQEEKKNNPPISGLPPTGNS